MDTGSVENDIDVVVLDVNDNLYEVNVLNSSQFEPKSYASSDLPEKDTFGKSDFSDFTKVGLDMKLEQSRDDEISEVRSMILGNKESKEIQKHNLLIDDLVYYLSNSEDDPCLRLHVPKHLRTLIVTQYHENNGLMGVQKTLNSIKGKYYWPNLFKEFNQYVSMCTICQTRFFSENQTTFARNRYSTLSYGKD